MTRKKMSLNDLKSLFGSYEPHAFKPSRATNKGFAHKHQPAYKPPKADMTPAKWHREQRAKSNRASIQHQLQATRHQCPICEASLPKLGWCVICRRWSVPCA